MSDVALEGFYDALLDDSPEELYDRAPCGYLSTDGHGVIVKANQTFLAMTGYDRGDLVGHRRFSELLSAGGRIYHETHYAPLLQMQGTAREIAFDLVRADGSRVPVLVNAVLERDLEGRTRVVRVAVFDATERREYERELLRAKERAERSEAHARELAETLQQTLIPPTPPVITGLEVATAYRPAGDGTEVGGDFFDVFQIGQDDWAVVIGDVRGKGVGAAAITALARHTLRAAAVLSTKPSHTLQVLNDVLLQSETDRFCTVALLRLTRRDERWQLLTCCGGHPLPLLLREGAPPLEVGRPGTLLGVVERPDLHDDVLSLAPGDCLFLYTDGVPDGRRGNEHYGEGRLVGVLSREHGSARDLADAVLDDVLRFQSGHTRDDVAVVVVRVPTGPAA